MSVDAVKIQVFQGFSNINLEESFGVLVNCRFLYLVNSKLIWGGAQESAF